MKALLEGDANLNSISLTQQTLSLFLLIELLKFPQESKV